MGAGLGIVQRKKKPNRIHLSPVVPFQRPSSDSENDTPDTPASDRRKKSVARKSLISGFLRFSIPSVASHGSQDTTPSVFAHRRQARHLGENHASGKRLSLWQRFSEMFYR